MRVVAGMRLNSLVILASAAGLLGLACGDDGGSSVGADAETGSTTDPDPSTSGGPTASGSTAPVDTGGSESTGGSEVDGARRSPCASASRTGATGGAGGADTSICDDDTCTTAGPPEGHVTCDLPSICGIEASIAVDLLCAMQALRYGIPGQITYEYSAVEVDWLTIEIFGDGRARRSAGGFSHGCCNRAGVDEYAAYSRPFAVPAADSPVWDDCIAEIEGGGFECVFEVNACEPDMLAVCPEPPAPPDDTSCEAVCPMAGDGVCDDDTGTGLCPAGCDPDDCQGE